eukprot:42916_1
MPAPPSRRNTQTNQQFYNELIDFSKECGVLATLETTSNISKLYKHIHSNYKSLTNGYIKTQITQKHFPIQISQIITIFYTSFKSKEFYDNDQNDKWVEKDDSRHLICHYDSGLSPYGLRDYLPQWIKGCKSRHIPTVSLCIFNIHKLLTLYSIHEFNDNKYILGTLSNTDVIKNIIELMRWELGYDLDLGFKCIQILRILSRYENMKATTTHIEEDTTHIEEIIQNVTYKCIGVLLDKMYPYVIKGEICEMLIDISNKHNHQFTQTLIASIMPKCKRIWNTKFPSSRSCAREPSELPPYDNPNIFCDISGSEYNNYNNSKQKYFNYLEQSSGLLYTLLDYTGNDDNNSGNRINNPH